MIMPAEDRDGPSLISIHTVYGRVKERFIYKNTKRLDVKVFATK